MSPENFSHLEFWGFAWQLNEILKTISPRSEEGMYLFASENDWTRKPFFYEQILIGIWIHFIEKQALGEKLDETDKKILIFGLSWAYSLKDKQIRLTREDREKELPLHSPQHLKVLKELIDYLEETTTISEKNLILASRKAIFPLFRDKIFNPNAKNLLVCEEKIRKSKIEKSIRETNNQFSLPREKKSPTFN